MIILKMDLYQLIPHLELAVIKGVLGHIVIGQADVPRVIHIVVTLRHRARVLEEWGPRLHVAGEVGDLHRHGGGGGQRQVDSRVVDPRGD